MSKTKEQNFLQASSQQLTNAAEKAGMLLMAAAAVVGMLELPDRGNRIVLPGQPSFAMATENDEFNNPARREREEAAPHAADYSITRRTPSRAARH